MTVPSAIRLLSQRVSVEVVKNLHHSGTEEDGSEHAHRAYGVYDEGDQSITLDASNGFERMRETFTHETLHAVLAVTHLDALLDAEADGLSEHVVSVLSPVILALLRDNPEAVNFLRETQT